MQTTFQPQPEPEKTVLPKPAQAENTAPVTPISPASNLFNTTDIEGLLTGLRQNARIRRNLRRVELAIGVVVLLFCAWYFAWGIRHHVSVMWTMIFHLFNGLAFLGAKLLEDRWSVSELARTENLNAIGMLTNIINTGQGHFNYDPASRRLAQDALTRLLPNLKASDAHLLNAEQRQTLNRALFTPDVPFTLAILKAWEQVGDSKAIPAVRALLNTEKKATKSTQMRERALTFLFGEKQTTGASVSVLPRSTKLLTAEQVAQIQDAALSCLRFLEQRAEQENASNTLLRAAAPNAESTPGVLLRPAQAQAASTAPDTLLRSASDRE